MRRLWSWFRRPVELDPDAVADAEDEAVELYDDDGEPKSWDQEGGIVVDELAFEEARENRRDPEVVYDKPVVSDEAAHLLLGGWHEHDHERMVCYDHTGRCCPADDAHDMVASEALMHRARAALAAAAPLLTADAPEVEIRDDGERRWVRVVHRGVLLMQDYLEGPVIPGAIADARVQERDRLLLQIGGILDQNAGSNVAIEIRKALGLPPAPADWSPPS